MISRKGRKALRATRAGPKAPLSGERQVIDIYSFARRANPIRDLLGFALPANPMRDLLGSAVSYGALGKVVYQSVLASRFSPRDRPARIPLGKSRQPWPAASRRSYCARAGNTANSPAQIGDSIDVERFFVVLRAARLGVAAGGLWAKLSKRQPHVRKSLAARPSSRVTIAAEG